MEQNLPKAEEVLERFILVTGSRSAQEKIHTTLVKGTVEFSGQGTRGTLISYQAQPNKSYKVMDLGQAGKLEEGTDGDVVWQRSTAEGPRVKTGQEKAVALREALINGRLHWRKLYSRAVCIGEEDVEGEACYKIILTPHVGNPVTKYYAKGSGLLVKSFMIAKTAVGEAPYETFFGDYREVEGVLMHHRLRHRVLNQEIIVQLESIQFNLDIPADRFEIPEDIKELIKKPSK
jgi:hypothetical protein